MENNTDIVENNTDNVVPLSKKAAANRRNAQLSTGPRTEEGKSRSRRNALKHGVLASALLITKGEGAEEQAEFNELVCALYEDLAPVGVLEEILVEKIAVCTWRQKRALLCENGMIRRAFVPEPQHPPDPNEEELVKLFGPHIIHKPNPELLAIRDHLRLPLTACGASLDSLCKNV